MSLKTDVSRIIAAESGKGNLSFAGNGKISVSVASIVNSARVQRQVKAVREIAASQAILKK